MGISITCHAEKRVRAATGEVNWQQLPQAPVFNNRDYALFDLLAGCGKGGVPVMIAKPRGLPKDATAEVRKSFGRENDPNGLPYLNDNQNYGTSWLTIEELEAVPWGLIICHTVLKDQYTNPEEMTLLEAVGEDVRDQITALREYGVERIVFWFDY